MWGGGVRPERRRPLPTNPGIPIIQGHPDMKISNVKVDSARAEAGEWVKGIPEMEDLELKVRGAHSASARALRNKLIRGLPSKIRNDPNGIPLDALDAIEAKVNVEVILIDWRNLEEGPYSKEKAEEYMTNPDYIFFKEAVNWASMRVGRQEAAAMDAELGNSSAASAGT